MKSKKEVLLIIIGIISNLFTVIKALEKVKKKVTLLRKFVNFRILICSINVLIIQCAVLVLIFNSITSSIIFCLKTWINV